MHVYSVMLREDAAVQAGNDPAQQVQTARLVREGFSWPAFLLGPVWLLWHRLWWPLATVLIVLLAVGMAPPWVQSLASLAVSLILGFEGNGLLRAGLERRGWREVTVLATHDRDEAELRLAGMLTGGDDSGRTVSPMPAATPEVPPVAARKGA